MARYEFKVTPIDGGEAITYPAYRTALWDAQDMFADLPKKAPTRQARINFAWAYFAAKEAGKLSELGVADDPEKGVRDLADGWDIDIDEAPLGDATKK
jgi:hypothetical protein